MLQKMMPSSASLSLKDVATLTLSITKSTATPLRRFCSSKEIPSLSMVVRSSGSTSSIDANSFFCLGAA